MRVDLSKKTNKEIVAAIKNENVIISCVAICETTKRKNDTNDVIEALIEKKESQESFWNNYLVSDFARAALHLLGKEEYTGKREEVLELIKANLIF